MVPSFSSNKLTELYDCCCCCCCTRCSGLGGGDNAESVVSKALILFARGGGGEASLDSFSTVGFESEIFFGGFSGLVVVVAGVGVFSSNACFSGLPLLLAKAGGGDRFSLSALMAARGMRMVGISDDDEDDDDDGLLEEGDKGDGDDFSGEDDDDD